MSTELPNIDDRDACLVYADWLIEQGDPLGELMAEELRNGRTDRRAEYLHAQFGPEILQEHWTSWTNGLVDRLAISTHRSIEAVEGIARIRAVQAIRALDFTISPKERGYASRSGSPDTWVDEPTEPSDFPKDPIPAFVKHGLPPSLRKLTLRLTLRQADYSELPVDLNPLYPLLSNLEELDLSPPKSGIGTLDLPSLVKLTTSFYNQATLRELARAKLPKVTSLTFYYANWSELPLLTLDGAPKLEHLVLAIRNAPELDSDFDSVAQAPILRRLRSVQFSLGDAQIPQLVAIAPALAHLAEVRIWTWDKEIEARIVKALTPVFGPRLKILHE